MSDLRKVSIIIPAYNAGEVFSETLRSVQSQTHPHWEAIIVDDGSTDATNAIASQFAQADRRFCILRHEKNVGRCAARNTALRHATGEWIAFQDADDVWLPEKTERQLQLLRADPQANFLFTNYAFWDGEKRLKTAYRKRAGFPEGNPLKKLVFRNLFALITVMVKRETLVGVGGFDGEFELMEDWDLWLRLAENGIQARGIWEPLSLYRQWPGNTSKNTVKMAECAVRVLTKAAARAQKPEIELLLKTSLASAQKNLELTVELARVAATMEEHPEVLPPAILKLWLHRPWRLEYLLWYLSTEWPHALGGVALTNRMHAKIRRKFNPSVAGKAV